MPDNNGEIRPGDYLKAAPIEAMRKVAARIGLSVQYPLELRRGPGGWYLRYRGTDEFWAKITSGGTGGKYAWKEQVPTLGGWQDGFKTGTTSANPAIEINVNTGVPVGTIVWLRRDSTEVNYRFIFSTCS